MTAPRLAAARLIRLNRRSRAGAKSVRVLLFAVAVLLALLWAESRAEPPLNWLRMHGLLLAALAAVASAVMVARRRALKREEHARSWLAAVPVRTWTARWESLFIETQPAMAVIGLLAVAAISDALVLMLKRSADVLAPFAVWGIFSCGIAAGVIGSFFIPQPKPAELPPGSRYVPHRKLNRAAKIQPSLRALGIWPIRQAFAWAQPKIVSRAIVPVLVMMPLGTTADSAMVVIALSGIFGWLSLVGLGVISASRLARRWLAPLPARPGEVMRAFLLPACAAIVIASTIEALLLLVVNVPLRTSAEAGAWTAVLGCLLTGGLFWNTRLP